METRSSLHGIQGTIINYLLERGFNVLLFAPRPKGENVDVKALGRDEESGIG